MNSTDTFFIESPYGKKKISNTITNTSEIFDEIPMTIPISEDEDKLSLYFNSIYIKESDNHPLLEIGYSPTEAIELKTIKEKTVFFSIKNVRHIFSYKIYSDYTCFDAELYFANLFFTVPRNIFVFYNGEKLDDDCYLFDLDNDKDSPFFISFEYGYQLFCTYLDRFSSVCMKSDSTLNNLKETLIYKTKKNGQILYGDLIKKYPGFTEKVDEKAVLSNIADKISIFDFKLSDARSKNIKVKFFIEVEKNKVNYELELPGDLTVYYLTIFLEETYKIDRIFFVAYGSQKRILQLDTKLKEVTKDIEFIIAKKINVKIEGEKKILSPITTIKDIQNEYNFAKSNFGIIINKHFVSSTSKNSYLNYYLNGEENTEILFKKPIEPCHIFTFKEKKKDSKYIVPDNMKNDVDKIISLYMNKSIDSIIINKSDDKANEWICEYKNFAKKGGTMKIHFCLVDVENKSHNRIVEVKGKNPRVIDFLLAITNKFTKQDKKNVTLDAYLSDRKLLFSQPLSQILYNKENKIKVNVSTKEKIEITILCMMTNVKITFDIEKLTTQKIIELACKKFGLSNSSNYSLFMEYNELQPNDYPYICTYEKKDFLLNQKSEKKTLFITNGTPLKFKLDLDKIHYNNISDYIRAIFYQDYLDFFHGTDQLPDIFDAGCFDNESVIRVEYNYQKTNKLTFCSEGKIFKLEISNIDLKIHELKSEIIKKIKKFDVPESSLIFKFQEQQLDVNKSFPEYKISEDSLIHICRIPQCFRLELYVPEKFHFTFYVSKTNTVQEIKDLIKIKYSSYNEDFNIGLNKNSILSDDENFKQDVKYYMYCKRIKIKSRGSLDKKAYKISEILTVKNAKIYIRKKFFNNNKNISIFVRNDKAKSFEKVDENKILFEIKDKKIYVTKLFILNSIKFENEQFNLNINSESEISECNTIKWFKRNIISKEILNNKKIMLLSESNENLNHRKRIFKSVKDTTNIVFAEKENANDSNKTTGKNTNNQSNNTKSKNDNDTKSDDDNDTKSDNDNDTKSDDDNDTKSDNDNDTKSDSDNDTKSDSDDDTKSDSNDSVEEEVENSDSDDDGDTDDGPKYKYKFQIGSNPVFTLKFKKDATIKDAKIKIAKIQDDIDPDCVSILFAGKNLNKSINIKSLKLTKNDILQVYIQNFEEIILRTAKALRFSGRNIRLTVESSDSEEEDFDDI